MTSHGRLELMLNCISDIPAKESIHATMCTYRHEHNCLQADHCMMLILMSYLFEFMIIYIYSVINYGITCSLKLLLTYFR